MKIAVTYENGMIFQHFGKSEAFKYYEADENGNIIAAEVKSNNGQGHGALADILKENRVDVIICGGIGEGAQDALAENGIEIYAGNAGSADSAVISFLAGKMEKKAVKCDHHEHEHGENHSCGEHKCK
ncbi:MAG: dinitrogenase iron-molybdenum cofactor biosynthesis protein [Clostridiales bacterium]|nr:dinitrogenase iron-molybdenum cofactor biosynthesis protein [Clostridiales bacterium]